MGALVSMGMRQISSTRSDRLIAQWQACHALSTGPWVFQFENMRWRDELARDNPRLKTSQDFNNV